MCVDFAKTPCVHLEKMRSPITQMDAVFGTEVVLHFCKTWIIGIVIIQHYEPIIRCSLLLEKWIIMQRECAVIPPLVTFIRLSIRRKPHQ